MLHFYPLEDDRDPGRRAAPGSWRRSPTLFSRETVESWPSWVPSRQLVLGLDLQGGALSALTRSTGRTTCSAACARWSARSATPWARNARIGYTGLGIQGQGVQVRIRDTVAARAGAHAARARCATRSRIRSSAARPSTSFDLAVGNDGLITMSYSEAGLAQRIRSIVDQSIEVIARAASTQLGTVEPIDPAPGRGSHPGRGARPRRSRATEIAGRPDGAAHLPSRRSSFPSGRGRAAAQGRHRIVLPGQENPAVTYVLREAPLITGEDLTDAQAAFDQRTNEPVVSFRLTTGGAQIFGRRHCRTSIAPSPSCSTTR